MKILIDLDDTVWDLLSLWVSYLNKLYNLDVKVDDIKEWDMTKTFPTLSIKQLTEPLISLSLWCHIKPKEDVIKYIELLNKEHDIYFVTATDYRNIEYKANILEKYFSFIPINRLIICHNKDMIKGDILIDDNLDNIKNRNKAILYTSPFNKQFDIEDYKNIIRLDNWEQIFNYIKELNKKC